VVRTHLLSRYEIAAEMYAWEVATALASSVLGVNPFDQPDVQLAKELAIRAMQGEAGEIEGEGDTIFASQAGQLERSLRELLSGVVPGGYSALQAFLPSSREISSALLEIQVRLQTMTGLVCTLGFGPRFLHSTGQLHKGGPVGGLFLQLVDEPAQDLPVPETEYSFARMIAAQSLGDLHALRRRGRRVLRISLGKDRDMALDRVLAALGRILSDR
jgi:transaldolase/glucose-6-phosphate isomerase